MKRKVISFLMALILAGSVAATVAGQAKASGYSSFGINHDSTQNALRQCELLPYAHYALEFGSLEYYIAHYNIQSTWNATELEDSFNRSITTSIFNSLDNSGAWDTFQIHGAHALHLFFGFDGEMSWEDLYDNILISMLLDKAMLSIEGTDVDEEKALVEFLDSVVTLTDSTDPVAKPLYTFLGSLGTNLKPFLDALSTAVCNAIKSNQVVNNIVVSFGNSTVVVNGGKLISAVKKYTNGAITASGVKKFLFLLGVALDFRDEQSAAELNCHYAMLIWKTLDADALKILTEMEKHTDSVTLRSSIYKYIYLLENDSIPALVAVMNDMREEADSEFGRNLLASAFKTYALGTNMYYSGAALGYVIFDFLGANYGSRSETIYIIRALHNVDQAVIQAMKSLEAECVNNYTSKDSVALCEAYNTGMLMSWRLQSLELDYALAYLDAHYSTKEFNKYFGSNDAWDDWQNNIENQQKLLDNVKPAHYRDIPRERFGDHTDVVIGGLTIKYDLNGGTGTIPDQRKPFFGAVTLSTTIPQKEGHTFLGWTIKGYELYPYSAGETLAAFPKNETSLDDAHRLEPCLCSQELVLTAAWTTESLIVYNANGGSNAPESQDNTPGATTLSTKIPTREGFSFLGWATSPDATEAEYAPGAEILTDGTVNLYAVWQAGSFNIVFHANGGTFETAGSTTIIRQKTYLAPFSIDVEAPTREGYVFAGRWSLNADGSGTTYTHGQVYTDIGGAGLSAKNLYAVWQDTTADILYDYADDPSGNHVTTVTDTLDISQGITSYTILGPDQKDTYNGSSFKGWIVQDPNGKYWWANAYADNGPCSIYQPGDQVWLNGDMVLYAKWSWLIHYDHDTEEDLYVHEETGSSTYTVAAPSCTREGMAFLHWMYFNEEGVVCYCKPGDQITLTSDLYLTAIWVDAVTGKVTDESGNPLEGTVVEFIGSDGASAGAVVTDSTGTYRFAFTKADTYRRIFTMPGYTVQTVDGLAADANLVSMGTTALTVDRRYSVTAAGACGELAGWHIVNDGKGGATLTIVGVGAMENYPYYGCGPWKDLLNSANHIVVNSGITTIGDWAFYGVMASSVTLPDTLISIGESAFRSLSMVFEITLPDSLVEIKDNAFHSASLTSITIPKNVRSLCEDQWYFYNPFHSCRKLTEIKVAEENPCFCSVDGVLYTKDMSTLLAYPEGRDADTLSIPEGVTKVEGTAFSATMSSSPRYTSALQVTIPSTLTEIGALSTGAPFAGYTVAKENPSLCSVDGVVFTKDMKTLVLYPCAKADLSYTVPAGVETIGLPSFYPFSYCNNLVTLTLPDGLKRIESSGFYQCPVLSNLIIPDTVTSLGRRALDQCYSLASVYFMGDLPTLDDDAVYPAHAGGPFIPGSTVTLYYIEGKAGWTSPTITVTNHSRQNTYNTAVFDPDKVDFTIAYRGSCGDDLTFEISTDMVMTIEGTGAMYSYSVSTMPWYSYKEMIREITVKSGATTVGNYAFSQMDSLTKVTLPDTIVYLAYYSFYANDSLTSIKLPAKLQTIYGSAFWGSGLEQIVIPDSVTAIGDGAFEFCEELVSVVLPDQLTALEINTFAYCRSLTSITLPDTLTSIGGSAFRNCESLTRIDLPSALKTIGNQAFCYCGSLEQVDIPKNVTSIGASAFESCVSMRSVTIPNGVTTIGNRAFANCEALAEVVLPDSVTSLGTYVFYSCSKLEKATLSAGLTTVPDSTFNFCDALSHVVIPEGITSIGNSAFSSCSSLTEIVLPKGLESVGSRAFAYCDALTSITFPASFRSLGSSVLSGDTSMTALYFYGDAPTDWAFEGLQDYVTDQITVYYTAGAQGWTTPTWRAPSGTIFKTALWTPTGSTPVSSLKVSGGNQVTCTVADGAQFTKMLVGVYDTETDRFIGTAMGLYDGSSNTITVTFDFTLPDNYALKVFCTDDNFAPKYAVGNF